MKLLSYEAAGVASFGAVKGDGVVDLHKALPDCPTLAAFLGSVHFERRDAIVADLAADVPLAEIVHLPVVPQPEKIVCVLRNYLEPGAAADAKSGIPAFPPIFLRLWRSQVGHGAPIIRPKVSIELDFEGELAVVIGRGGRHIRTEEGLDHVAGYSIYNDVSVRDWQRHAQQIASGKNFVGTGPFGPWLVTPDEIPDPHVLGLRTLLNGEEVQCANTSQLIFGVADLIAYCSTIFDLVPGDVIVTGTPAGIGISRKPPLFMKPGDTIEVEIEKIGRLGNRVEDE